MSSPFIPYGRQNISAEDEQAVLAVLRSDYLTQGPAVQAFEEAVARYCGARFAVAVSNATAALHIACLAAGLGEGDELWTSPNTFVASANCGRYCNSTVDFVDIDPKTYNLSVDHLAAKLEARARNGQPIPKVLIPVHFAGQACEMDRIASLKAQYGFSVIEDASHAIGGSYREYKIGAGKHSDMTVLSFHPVKLITTGEGGMILTNDEKLYSRLVRLRTHGITRDPSQMSLKDEGSWYYEQLDLGFNYRLTDIQAALGHSQLKRLDRFVERRHALAKRYDEALADLPLIRPFQRHDTYSAYHLYVVQLLEENGSPPRRKTFEMLREGQIGVNVHYFPVHLQPYYRNLGFREGQFPVAERYYSRAITLPLFATLTDQDQDRVISTVRNILTRS